MAMDFVGDHRARLGESPLWDARDGKLLWVDSMDRKIFRANADGGEREEWTAPSMVGSIALAETGVLAALQDGFYALDFATGRFDAIALPERDNTGVRFNDGKADRRGRFLSGTMGMGSASEPPGKLYRLEPDGTATLLETGIGVSNGLCFSPSGDTLYFADSIPCKVWAYDYDGKTGTVQNRRTLIDTTTLGSAPDGATVDASGDLWVALFQIDQLIRVSPQGQVLETINVPVRFPSCPAFGGSDLGTLYVTSISDAGAPFVSDHPDAGRTLAITGLGAHGIAEARCAVGAT